MADAEVKLKFAGSSADAERAIATLEKKIQQLEQGLKSVSQRVKQNAKDAAESWNVMTDGAVRFGASVTGISSVLDVTLKGVELLRNSWDEVIARQERALGASQSNAAAFVDLLANSTSDPKYGGDSKKLHELIDSVSKETQASPLLVTQVLSSGASARGSRSVEDVAGASIPAILAFKESLPTAVALSKAVGDLQSQMTGLTGQQGVGFVLKLQEQGHMDSAQDTATYGVQAALGGATLGKVSPEYAASLFAAGTNMDIDPHGRFTRTGTLAMISQVQSLFGHEGTFEENLAKLRANPELTRAAVRGEKYQGKDLDMEAASFDEHGNEIGTQKVKKFSFEKQFQATAEDFLLNPEGKMAVDFKRNLESYGSRESLADVFDKFIAPKKTSGPLQANSYAQAIKAAEERAQLKDSEGAIAATTRKAAGILGSSNKLDPILQQMLEWQGFFNEFILRQGSEGRLKPYREELAARERGAREAPTAGLREFDRDQAEILRSVLKEIEDARFGAGIGGAKLPEAQRDVPPPQLPPSNSQTDGRSVEQLEAEQRAKYKEYREASAEGDEKAVKELKEAVRLLGDLIAQAKKDKRLPVERNGQVGG